VPPIEGSHFADADLVSCCADAFPVVHGLNVVMHFLFVVYPMKRGVDGFFEGPRALLASVALYAEVAAVTVEFGAAAPRAREAGEAGGEGKDGRMCSLGVAYFYMIHKNVDFSDVNVQNQNRPILPNKCIYI